MYNRSRKRGFIKAIVLIIVALVLLKYFFGITFYDILHNQVISDIWSIIKSLFGILWNIVVVILDFLKQLVGVAKTSVEGMKN